MSLLIRGCNKTIDTPVINTSGIEVQYENTSYPFIIIYTRPNYFKPNHRPYHKPHYNNKHKKGYKNDQR